MRVSFGGRNPHRTATGFGACSGLGPTSVAVSVLIPVPPRPWGGGANRAPTAPPVSATVRRGGRNGPRLYPLVSLPWRRAANPAPKVPPVFATVGRGPDCTGGAFEHRKGGYPLSRVPYSRRRTGTSPLPGPPAAALVWVPCRAWNAIRETPGLPSVPRRPSGRGFLGCPRRLPRFLGSDRILGPCGGKRGHPRDSRFLLGSPSVPRERLLGYPRGFPRFKRGLSCIRGEPRASERAAEPRNPLYIVRARHMSRRAVALRSARSGRRKPAASATLGGERPTRRASLPCWTSCGAQTELGAPDHCPFPSRSGQRVSGIAVGETSNKKRRLTCGSRPCMRRRVSASIRQVTTFVPRSTLQRGRSTTREG